MEHDADCTLVTFSMTYRKFPVFVLVSGSAKLYLLIQSWLKFFTTSLDGEMPSGEYRV